jgi:hypothetical protein
LLEVVVARLMKVRLEALAGVQMALLAVMVIWLEVVAELSLLGVHPYLKQALHCKAVLQALRVILEVLVVAVVDTGAAVLVQIQTQVLLVVVVLLISTHLLLQRQP